MNPSSERELLPCPFCGGHADLAEDTDRPHAPWTAFCEACDACTGNFDELDKAISAWERRAALFTQPQQAVAWVTTNEEGESAMLFFDKQEARHYCGEDEEPRALGFIDLPQQAGWMPIETAPKDQVIDLLTKSGVRLTEQWWDKGDECWVPGLWPEASISHWMPLPPVPGQEGVE